MNRQTVTVTLFLLLIGVGGGADPQNGGAPLESTALFSYPGEGAHFHDFNPIWHPNERVLALTRAHLSGMGGQSLFYYAPGSDNRDTVPLTARRVSQTSQSADAFPALPQQREVTYLSQLIWLPTRGQIHYTFLYEQLGVLAKGELTITGGNTRVTSSPFIDLGRESVLHIDCSPGLLVAYTTERSGMIDLYVKPVANTDPKSPGALLVGTQDTEELTPNWSHEGKYLVYVANHQPEGKRISLDLFLLKYDPISSSCQPIHLIASPQEESLPTFSPKDDFVAFYRTRREETKSDEGKVIYDLWVVRLTEEKEKADDPILIDEDVYRQPRGPVWISGQEKNDGQYLIYTVGTRDAVWIANVEQFPPQPKRLEGLAGYENDRLLIGDLDCRGYGGDELFLAYSARVPSGELRLYVEKLRYRKPIPPFSIQLSGEGNPEERIRSEFSRARIELGKRLEITPEKGTQHLLIDRDTDRILILSREAFSQGAEPRYQVIDLSSDEEEPFDITLPDLQAPLSTEAENKVREDKIRERFLQWAPWDIELGEQIDLQPITDGEQLVIDRDKNQVFILSRERQTDRVTDPRGKNPPFSVTLSGSSDEEQIRAQFLEKEKIDLGGRIQIKPEKEGKRLVIDRDKKQIFIISPEGSSYNVMNSWYVEPLEIPTR